MPLLVRLRVTWRALPAMAVPFVVLMGIYGGFMTVTESAAHGSGHRRCWSAWSCIAASIGRARWR